MLFLQRTNLKDKITPRNYPNGVVTTYEYDNMDGLKLLRDVGPSGTLFDRQYAYNSANQISQITELTGTRMFGYDNVNRLTNVTGSTTESYLFDDVGNRTSSHRASSYGYQSGQFNRLSSAVTPSQTLTYGYDANGNMTTKAEGKEFWRYTWDYENRMSEAATRKQKVRYKYDALGRRVARGLGYGKESTKFTYDGEDVLVDDNAGTLTKYLNGGGIDNKLRQTTGSTASYFLADHLGSTNGLINSSGGLMAANSYDSFGNPTNTSFSTRYQFTGREFDKFTGLQFSRARFYDPNLGRFISEDPIGLRGGDVNLYGYVFNNPIQFTDADGLQAQGGLTFVPGGKFGEKWYPQLLEDFNDMRKEGCACRESFKGFGVDLDDLSNKGIVIGSGQGLSNPSIPSSDLRLSDKERVALTGRNAKASTLLDGEIDSRPHIFFFDDSTRDAWGFYGSRCALRQALAHEMMHAGRIEGRPPSLAAQYLLFQDDLSYLNGWLPWNRPYSSLPSNCGCQ